MARGPGCPVKPRGWGSAGISRRFGKAHGVGPHTRRRSGLVALELMPCGCQRLRQEAGRWLALPSFGARLASVPRDRPHKGSGGDDHAAGGQPAPIGGHDPPAALPVAFQIGGFSAHHVYARVPQDHVLRVFGIGIALILHPQGLHRWPLAGVQHTGMDGGGVGQLAHQAAQRLHLEDKLAFAGAADCRVAGHPPDGGRIAHQQGHPRSIWLPPTPLPAPRGRRRSRSRSILSARRSSQPRSVEDAGNDCAASAHGLL